MAAALAKHGYAVAETCYDLRYDALSHTPDEATIQGIALLEDETDAGLKITRRSTMPGFPMITGVLPASANCRATGRYIPCVVMSASKGRWSSFPATTLRRVYALHAENEQAACALLKALLWQNETAEFGVNEIVFLAQTENEAYFHAALACGFTLFGRYSGWKKTIE